jgi:hypothetical protein
MEDNQDMAAAMAFTKAMINGIPALVLNATSIDGRAHVEIAVRLPSLPGARLQPKSKTSPSAPGTPNPHRQRGQKSPGRKRSGSQKARIRA